MCSKQPAQSADLGDWGVAPTSKIRLGSTQTLLATTSDFVIAISDIPYICYDFVRQRITLPDIFCGVIAKEWTHRAEYAIFILLSNTVVKKLTRDLHSCGSYDIGGISHGR